MKISDLPHFANKRLRITKYLQKALHPFAVRKVNNFIPTLAHQAHTIQPGGIFWLSIKTRISTFKAKSITMPLKSCELEKQSVFAYNLSHR